MEGRGGWGKEGSKDFGSKEREKEKDVWPRTETAEEERKWKGEDQITKNWGLKSLKEVERVRQSIDGGWQW